MSSMWSTPVFRWLNLGFPRPSPTPVFQWPEFNLSYLTSGWSLQSLRWVVFSIVDDVLLTLVTAFECLALVTTLCFFFLFCGCTF
ncbi:hypothetical protein ES332_D09G083100v1 [Gossypium tomentosum]|uniref:Transmembrane protein n=1 Tax=Gossypium tomentosum TaxID=34277 RepID=A0A5D2JEX5_GOSTO|nr:hypothetical protein ES332_D09G083100v1 [Gossypium tomentosum]